MTLHAYSAHAKAEIKTPLARRTLGSGRRAVTYRVHRVSTSAYLIGGASGFSSRTREAARSRSAPSVRYASWYQPIQSRGSLAIARRALSRAATGRPSARSASARTRHGSAAHGAQREA